ncbi:hypothetical protein Scep_023468 [Stephania cephalantha]|uniref:Transmembrane protein n=1 Tax=Stephania cephalantha TaxID=152367 RepID=A0AAP0F081_9MAGN
MAKQVDTNMPFNMNYPSQLLSVFGIFISSIKNFHKNRLLILSVTFFTIFLNIGVIFVGFLLLTPLFNDMFSNYDLFSSYDPASSTDLFQFIFKIQKDVTTLLGEQLIIVLALYVVSWFSTVATIYVSAMSHLHKDLTLQELVLGTKKIWRRLVVTSFYASLLDVGYSALLFVPFVMFFALLFFGSWFMFLSFIALLIFPCLLFLYLTVVWTLSLVVSVLEEEASGFQALGKAERLISGRKVQGFVICLVFMVVSTISAFVMISTQEVGIAVVVMVVKMVGYGLLKMFSLMVYTVFYFECKKSHGEEIEILEVDMSYTKASTIPLVDSTLP